MGKSLILQKFWGDIFNYSTFFVEKRYQNVENCNPPFGLPANWLNKTIVLLAVTIEFPYCFIQIQTSENTNNKDKEAGGVDLRLESCQLRAGMGPSCSWKYSSNSPVGFTPYFIYGILLCLPLRSNSITNNLIGRSQFYCPYA